MKRSFRRSVLTLSILTALTGSPGNAQEASIARPPGDTNRELEKRPPAPWARQLRSGAELPQSALLAVEVIALNPVTARADSKGKRQNVRDAESRYMTYQLRTLLEQSEQFGPVRMLEAPSPGHELQVGGSVIAATPTALELAITVTDSAGNVWLSRSYAQTVAAADYAGGEEPFIRLYERIIADLVDQRNGQTLEQLNTLLTIATLRRAQWLAPKAFSNYLVEEQGQFRINRLPAENDPLFASVARIAEAQALFADAVDPNYQRFFTDIGPTYRLWRKTLADSDQLMTQYRKKSAGRSARDKNARSLYLELRELKLHQQTVRETMESFVFRTTPTRIEAEGQLVELNGTLAEQSAKWRDILSRKYAAEVGL